MSVPSDPHATPAHCANCGQALGGHFCSGCGQEAVLHMPSASEFLHEFVGHYVALENKLAGSLTRLLFRPGLLTNEYIAGRRVRYLQPLRLYLTLSILFFAIIKFDHPQMIGPGEEAGGPCRRRQEGPGAGIGAGWRPSESRARLRRCRCNGRCVGGR